MNWKNRLTNYNFWISIFSAVLLILQALKIEFDIAYVNEIFTAVLGLLVVIGIISDPTRTTVKTNEKSVKTETKVEEVKEQIEDKNLQNATLPNEQENETNCFDSKNDFQVILNKISFDLDEKIKELEKIKLETLNNSANQNKVEDKVEVKVEEVKPAVAEITNPYIDTIN